jgi:DNA modification methylase
MNKIEFGDCRDTMRRWANEGVKAQMCVTSPPYFGLRDYGHEGQIGLEETPEQFITAMVEVFRCVRDVLADDGTLWLNIGDSYASYRDGKATPDTTRGESIGTLVPKGSARNRMASTFSKSSVKHKDLIGIPWMLAFALRADGWYLRQDIIWHKPNPMPESVRDRCTKAHEYLFLLSKSDRYFFDSEALKEPATNAGKRVTLGAKSFAKGQAAGLGIAPTGNGLADFYDVSETRNRRSVWTVATRPYKGAHFATFPPALIEPCILAGSMPIGAYEPDDLILSPNGEGKRDNDPSMIVGRAGWSRPRRDVEAIRPMSRAEQAAYAEQLRNSPHRESMVREAGGDSTFAHYVRTDRSGARAVPPALFARWVDLGWLNCVSIPPALAVPHRSIVLDPFMGSGTTAQVALQHGRQYLGCELNRQYENLQSERLSNTQYAINW